MFRYDTRVQSLYVSWVAVLSCSSQWSDDSKREGEEVLDKSISLIPTIRIRMYMYVTVDIHGCVVNVPTM